MITRPGNRLSFYQFLLLTVLIAGCAANSPPPRLYLLSAGATQSGQVATGTEFQASVGLGPITLPDYLDRPQIVTRATANRLEASENHRWAEPLAAGVTRVLTEQIAALLSPGPVIVHPWKRAEAPAWQVRVELLRLEAGPDQALHLAARWTITNRDNKPAGDPRRSEHSVAVDPADHEALVRATGEALAFLAREIATAVAGVAGDGQAPTR